MRKFIPTFIIPFLGISVQAQVGIHNTSPKATLDITAKTTNGTAPEGLIAPRLTGDQIKAADAQYTADQTGTILYATAAVTVSSPKTANMTMPGYYFFDGTVWIKILLEQNIYNTDGTLTGDRTVSQAANNLAFTSTATTGTSHFTVDGTTLNVDAVNNRVGIGAAAPANDLQVVGNEVRVGGPSTQVGTVADPVVRIHSNASADANGGTLMFNEDNTNNGYYLKQNTAAGTVNGAGGLAIGAAQAAGYAYNPARPGVFISSLQNIGFGTATPQAAFHIDGARDNAVNTAPTVAQQANDLVVNTSGNMGIGTASPTAKLQINSSSAGAFKLTDGTQVADRVLTSDANGVGTWQATSYPAYFTVQRASVATDTTIPANTNSSLPGINNVTITKTGKYEILFHSFLFYPGAAGPKSFYALVRLNGVDAITPEETYSYVGNTSYLNQHYSTVINATAGDVLSFLISPVVGGNAVLQASTANRNKLEIIYLGL
ncbi:hypothetical protein NK356_23200 [Chryseobacterium sp. S0630]|uniref:hypothetical protein n=1 Tax=Chryseobacterium sp. S0630 TaxID=2957803 RepID=UPI0020A02FD0|nr:hypothetical protein [Chryseobacterium sp. S0630]MCP1302085.1 hypothetical protein [Chryseobacterium sp. S0630]